jgi:hypothetical protein
MYFDSIQYEAHFFIVYFVSFVEKDIARSHMTGIISTYSLTPFKLRYKQVRKNHFAVIRDTYANSTSS